MTNTGILHLHTNGIHIELGGRAISQIKIPSDFVAYTFAPILGTHLLLTGDMLVNGMVVVLEDHMMRGNPNDLSPESDKRQHGYTPSEYDRRKIEEGARWALVTDVRVKSNGSDSQIVKFTAIYSDGTMRDRTYNVDYKWAVLTSVEALPLCSCGRDHSEEEDIDIDQMTRDVTSQLFDEEMDFEEFLSKVKEEPTFIDEIFNRTLGKITSGFLGSLLPGEPEEESDEEDDDEPRPDETPVEFLERMRDKAEERGEYSQDERPKLTLAEDPAIAALRAKLMGQPAPTETGLNGYPVDPAEEAAARRERNMGAYQAGLQIESN